MLGKLAHKGSGADRSLPHEQNGVFRAQQGRNDVADIGPARCDLNRWRARRWGGGGAFERVRRPLDEHRPRLAFERKPHCLLQLRPNVRGLVDAEYPFDERRRNRSLVDGLEMEPMI